MRTKLHFVVALFGATLLAIFAPAHAQRIEAGHETPRRELRRADRLADALREMGVDVADSVASLSLLQTELALARRNRTKRDLTAGQESPDPGSELPSRIRQAVRDLAFSNPLLDFDDLLFVQRAPSSYAHMSDQYLGWFSRPGGKLCVLEDFKSDHPRLRCLTDELPEGDVLRPDLSFDGKRVLFSFCRYYPGLAGKQNKLDKETIPEDAFYHLYEIGMVGTGLRRLTQGKHDDMDGRYLPDGRIVFLSTRRGQSIQCDAASDTAMTADSYMRCGGSRQRPVPVYTLHVMDRDGRNPHAISAFESFEWHPSVANDGRILYARWDYVDRNRLPYVSLWSTLSDGSAAQAIFGNFMVNPIAMFEPRAIPNSRKIVFTASAQHSITGGSLVLLDPDQGPDVPEAMTRLTPEVRFPESEGWPRTYYANPYPLSEQFYLVAWSNQPLVEEGLIGSATNPCNALGLYLYDVFGNRVLIFRDQDISSMYPIPVRSRTIPPQVAATTGARRREEGRMLVTDAYQGLEGIPRGTVRRLRIVGMPPKTQPIMNYPPLGVTDDDPGKFVLGTVPVEADGSAFFRVPANVPLFLQALDEEGMAVQTMRSATYIPANQTYSCVGCHEPRTTAPPNTVPIAALRKPSRITLGPDGSWPLEFAVLVQPVLDQHCVSCHHPGGSGNRTNLRPGYAYENLIAYGRKSTLQSHVLRRYFEGYSTAGACGARSSELLQLIQNGHYDVQLDASSMDRLVTWMDTYAQQAGSFGPQQREQLLRLRRHWSSLLAKDGKED